MISLISSYGLALKRGYRAKSAEELIPLVLLNHFVMNNITESYIFAFNWILLVITALSLKNSLWIRSVRHPQTDVAALKAPFPS
ncbi:MAG: hypothetical protein HC881_15020 [Leptolyngbyaceae cyanobacterium SL_7_1]|nr:hypothetical protein [Leptolyngbyaceae cyanobacterium SL_7_1]